MTDLDELYKQLMEKWEHGDLEGYQRLLDEIKKEEGQA